jgi:hypothetical protein
MYESKLLDDAMDELISVMNRELRHYGLDIHGNGSDTYDSARMTYVLIRNYINLEE